MLTTVLIIVGTIAVMAVVLLVLMKKGRIKDEDGDFIPDALEDMYQSIDEIHDELYERVVEMKKEYQDVKEALENLKKQVGDVGKAAKGQKIQDRKPRNKK